MNEICLWRFSSKISSMSFFASLPRPAKADPAASPTPPVPVGGGNPLTLLVVDDSALIRKAVTQMLEGASYVVVSAENGRKGLDEWERNPERYSLVLSDVFMPVMDGLTFGRELRKRSRTLPIVLMSSKLDEDSRWIAEEAGFRLIPKPFKDAYLLELVARMIQMRPAH
jgi:two-component system, chemotaxis family, chemotaxis protein CheY